MGDFILSEMGQGPREGYGTSALLQFQEQNGTGGPSVSYEAATDRVFHLDMTAIPKSGVVLLSGIGLMLLLRRRK